jgi:hypothetical protein
LIMFAHQTIDIDDKIVTVHRVISSFSNSLVSLTFILRRLCPVATASKVAH